MTILERIIDIVFSGIIHRERQRARAYAALALATWRRHDAGKPVESAESVKSAAEFIVAEDSRTGNRNWQTKQAEALLNGLHT